jgi:hypothetical protein
VPRTTTNNTSTPATDLSLEAALAAIPTTFKSRLLKTYGALKDAFSAAQYDAAGIRAGKFSEVVLRFLQKELTGQYTPFGTRIQNFAAECGKLEKVPKDRGPESLRVIVPKALTFLYTMRNKRGIGHEGGDIDANEIDAATCVRLADWCLCEIVRVYHALSLEEAQAILDAISERELSTVWAVGGKKRILDPSMNYREQVLALLYSDPDTALPVEELLDWIEHPRMQNFKRDILVPLHRKRLIEFDRETATAVISPLGAEAAEALLRS